MKNLIQFYINFLCSYSDFLKKIVWIKNPPMVGRTASTLTLLQFSNILIIFFDFFKSTFVFWIVAITIFLANVYLMTYKANYGKHKRNKKLEWLAFFYVISSIALIIWFFNSL